MGNKFSFTELVPFSSDFCVGIFCIEEEFRSKPNEIFWYDSSDLVT